MSIVCVSFAGISTTFQSDMSSWQALSDDVSGKGGPQHLCGPIRAIQETL